jgi:hypothetical protein
LAYSRKRWEIEIDTHTDVLIKEFDGMSNSGNTDFDMIWIKDRNREMILQLLDKVKQPAILDKYSF